MKQIFVKAMCLMLVLLTLLVSLAACADDSAEEENTTEAPTTTGGPTVPEGPQFTYDDDGYVVHTIDRTLGGKEINILMDTSSRPDIMPAEYTSGVNVIVDKAFVRTVELEVWVDCIFNVSTAPGEWANKEEFVSAAESAENIDLICAFSLVPSMLQQKGLLSNLNNLEYPALEMPWWPESIRGWEHNTALYYVANNSSNRVIRAQEVVFVNKKMVTDMGLRSVEELVLSKEWTIGKMLEYAKLVESDPGLPVAERTFGLVIDDESRIDQFYYGSGLPMTKTNSDGQIELALFDKEHVEKATALVELLGSYATMPGFLIDDNTPRMLRNDQTLFFAGYINHLLQLEDASVYQPVPTPMFDTDQGRYYTTPHNSYDVWCIPHTCKQKEDAGLVIEALAYTDYRQMAPFFYEQKLKFRYSTDAIGVRIFDLIRSSTNIDFGRVAAASLGVIEATFRQCFWNGENQLYVNKYSSLLGTREVSYKNELIKVLATFHKYKGQ